MEKEFIQTAKVDLEKYITLRNERDYYKKEYEDQVKHSTEVAQVFRRLLQVLNNAPAGFPDLNQIQRTFAISDLDLFLWSTDEGGKKYVFGKNSTDRSIGIQLK